MKNLRRDFERFCYRHQNKGIPNLMLYVAIATAVMKADHPRAAAAHIREKVPAMRK